MDFLCFEFFLYGLVAWPIYALLGYLVKRLTPPPPPEVRAKLEEARAKARQALNDIERHDRGEDPSYWGDSDIDRLDMALAELSESRYNPVDEYFPWWVKALASFNLAKGLLDLALRIWFHGEEAFREVQDWAWAVGYLGIGIIILLISLFAWYTEGRRKA